MKTESFSKIDFNLYLITDRKATKKRPLINVLKMAIDGGVKAIQIREKDMSGKELFLLAKELRDITKGRGVKLFINDRIDIAILVKADGVHLGQNSIPADTTRKIVGNNMLIGVSTHSLNEAKEAENMGADFITLGPIFPTGEKIPIGINSIDEVVNNISIPIFAIGGINREKIPDIKKRGINKIALISAIIGVEDVKEETERIINELNKIN